MNLAELDALMVSVEMPVRAETLVQAWELTEVRRPNPLPAGQVLALITMRAQPGLEDRLESAARDFVEAASGLSGALGSTLHRSSTDPRTWYLLERFASAESFERHMGSDYFARFQAAQASLLAEPVTALFLERGNT
jgi:quinol monooxygenase YgiN